MKDLNKITSIFKVKCTSVIHSALELTNGIMAPYQKVFYVSRTKTLAVFVYIFVDWHYKNSRICIIYI